MGFSNRIRRRLTRLGGLVAFALLCLSLATPAPARAAPILTLTPSAAGVDVGDLFTVDLTISGAVGLFGWQVDIAFDSPQINVLSTAKGTFLTTGPPPALNATFFINGAFDNGTPSGLVDNMAETRTGVDVGATGAGLLATLTFQGVGPGVASLTIGNVVLSDAAAQPLTVGTLTGTSVTVTAVPEPGTWMLLLSGLSGMAAFRRTRRRARA